jgi:hypothetical protein
MLFLHPHTTNVLQPFDITVFDPIGINCHQKATDFTYDNPNSAIRKFIFGKLLSSAWKKGTTVGNVVRCFECTHARTYTIYLLTLPLSPKTNFYPLHTLQNSANFPSEGTHKIPSKSHKPSGPPVLQSTAD